MTYIFDSDS